MLEHSNMVTNCLEDSVGDVLFKSLIDVLTKELDIFNELKDFLSSEKRMLLKSATLNAINENNAVKENIILKARILEEVRTNILRKIAANFYLENSEIRLISLVNYAEIDQKEIINNLKKNLTNIAKDINRMNLENRYLIDTSINNINESLEFISSLINQSGVYLGNGKIEEIGKNGRLLRTEG